MKYLKRDLIILAIVFMILFISKSQNSYKYESSDQYESEAYEVDYSAEEYLPR
jgi:hypothetical protein